MISISNYTLLDEKKIISFLADNGISVCEIRNGKQTFMKSLNPAADLDVNSVFNSCGRRLCTFLSDGCLAACVQPFKIHYFNERFGTTLSDKGAVSIYEPGIDGYKILSVLSRPMDACRYCGYEEPFEWEVSREPIAMEEWCVSQAS